MKSFIEIGPVVLEKKILLISSMYFHNFVIISIWKRAGTFKLESPAPKDALCQVWLKLSLASGSGEEDFFYFLNVFFAI